MSTKTQQRQTTTTTANDNDKRQRQTTTTNDNDKRQRQRPNTFVISPSPYPYSAPSHCFYRRYLAVLAVTLSAAAVALLPLRCRPTLTLLPLRRHPELVSGSCCKGVIRPVIPECCNRESPPLCRRVKKE